jgi:hypothetical protein
MYDFVLSIVIFTMVDHNHEGRHAYGQPGVVTGGRRPAQRCPGPDHAAKNLAADKPTGAGSTPRPRPCPRMGPGTAANGSAGTRRGENVDKYTVVDKWSPHACEGRRVGVLLGGPPRHSVCCGDRDSGNQWDNLARRAAGCRREGKKAGAASHGWP